jgi:hypothetical protein
MKRILAALLALALSFSSAAQSYVDEKNKEYVFVNPNSGAVLVLHGTPCKDPAVLRHIYPQFRGDFNAATATYNGQTYALCYDAADMERRVHVLTPEGGETYLPRDLFVERLGT